mgnify:CR=1 FL=1
MRKKSVKTTAKSTEAITETAAKVKETVKAAAKKVEESAPAEKTAEVVKEVVQKAEKTVKTATKTATKAVRKAAGARVKEVSLEIFETNVSLKDVEKAVKKDVAEKGLTGDICIYINAERRAAYYTVNQEGSDEYKVDLGNL